MSVIGVIPARGGSKGIPRKNLAILNGKLLIAYTCEAALASKRLDGVYVSTEDDEIADTARRHGVTNIIRRPCALADGETLMAPVLAHAVSEVSAGGTAPDVVVLLQPTSPLRRAEHIDAGVDLFFESGADTVVSVVPVPHQYNPVSVLVMDGRTVTPFLDTGPPITRRQDKPPVYARNGPAVLVTRPAMIEAGDFYGGVTVGLEMTAEESVDIDAPRDIAYAAWLLSRKEIQQ